ncbi:fic family toxin-antitoxin system, toxin component [Streptomyces spongiicola]|uniref:Fic family toxin-antitoxin system, toxin component n=1 Tax=Streptomyces spongiicola TaxID=1690221 RepID=A0A2S1YZ01_9ACTN|nr:fic family toxin-antitoxin system, toxin component [Streptomyces spongiicola]AWK09296.1 fic family toxin-antitoxin system, toxin component [Streptomyces spongiicola]GBP99218.1 fic family toxin-antitoxin system, toxin component [Streptomyces spongiicola]
MSLSVDLAWLLMVAERKTPGDPQVTDWGALIAAVSRHEAEIFGMAVYDDPYTRAAALMQMLLHVPALEHSNAMFAMAVAYGYLVASGLRVAVSAESVRDLARLVKDGKTGVHGIARELRGWVQ